MEDQRVVIDADVHVVGSNRSRSSEGFITTFATTVPNIVVLEDGFDDSTVLTEKGMKNVTQKRNKDEKGGARPKPVRGASSKRIRTVSTASSLCPQARQKKIYSVSFQENGFSYRETSYLDATDRWGPSFSCGDDDEQDISRYTSTSPTITIPTTNCQNDNVNRNFNVASKSFDASKQVNYQSFGGGTPPSAKPSPVVFCIHGNKFGVAHCCDDLWPKSEVTDFAASNDDREQLIKDDEPRRKQSGEEIHCHSEVQTNPVDKRARRKLIIASVLCLFFMVVEIVGGVLANSLAIATDAAHLLTDFASFMISLFSLWVASRPATRSMSFGWHRAEVIGATVSVLMIWVVTGVLVYAAIQRISAGTFDLDPTIMLITSGIGVIVNIIMGCSLHQHGHSHGGGGGHSHSSDSSGSHGHSHDDRPGNHGHSHRDESHSSPEDGLLEAERLKKEADAKKRENINVRAAFIHVIGDFIQSLGVFIAALIIYFYPAYIIIDPICTFIFSVLVLLTTVRILKDTMVVLMEGIPRDISFTVVQETFLSVEGIVAVHNLRIWGLTTDKSALAAHLAVASGSNYQKILKEASTRIRAKYDFYEMTLQIEEFHEDMDDCSHCQAPQQ